MMTHQEMIDVITHHMNGGKIQFLNSRDIWEDCNMPNFNFNDYTYRAKPEPLVLWAVFSDKFINSYANHDEAEKACKIISLGRPSAKVTIKKFIEVI